MAERLRQQGGVLIFVLVILFSSMVIVVAWSKFAQLNFRKTIDQESEERAFQAAEAGIDFVLHQVNSGGYSLSQITGGYAAQEVGDENDKAIFQLNFGGGTCSSGMESIGWYGDQCQRVCGQVGSFVGVLGGPFYYLESMEHDVDWHGPCPAKPTVGFAPLAETFNDDLTGTCWALGSEAEVGCTGPGLCWSTINVEGDIPGARCSSDGMTLASGGTVEQDSGGLYQANTDYSSNDYTITVTQNNDLAAGVLAARVQDINNMYIFKWNGSQDDGIYKSTSATGWTWVAPYEGDVANGSEVSFRVIGNRVSALVNGIEVISYVDDSPISTGAAGMGVGYVMEGMPVDYASGGGGYSDFKILSL